MELKEKAFAIPAIKELFYQAELLERKNQLTPSTKLAFRALELCPIERTKVLILGQDPYPERGVADGLAFSTQGKYIPPTLANIICEVGVPLPSSGRLDGWARQGVLLWNVAPFTKVGKRGYFLDHPGSIALTRLVLEELVQRSKPLVAMLWGKAAQSFAPLLEAKTSYLIKTAHPSPLSARLGFFGSGCFFLANEFLRKNNLTEVNWHENI